MSNEERSQPPSPQEQFILIVAAILFPPLPIFIVRRYNICNKEFIISVLLTILGHLPGIIFALYFLLCVYFPQQGLEGYTRLPDDVEQQLHAESDANAEPHQRPHEVHRIHHDEEHTQPDPSQVLTASDLPAYEDIAGPSAGTEHPRDVKGDNKVQH
ncbi:OSR8 Hydrophobic protein OSR8 [Candida maltosa Xu316]